MASKSPERLLSSAERLARQTGSYLNQRLHDAAQCSELTLGLSPHICSSGDMTKDSTRNIYTVVRISTFVVHTSRQPASPTCGYWTLRDYHWVCPRRTMHIIYPTQHYPSRPPKSFMKILCSRGAFAEIGYALPPTGFCLMLSIYLSLRLACLNTSYAPLHTDDPAPLNRYESDTVLWPEGSSSRRHSRACSGSRTGQSQGMYTTAVDHPASLLKRMLLDCLVRDIISRRALI